MRKQFEHHARSSHQSKNAYYNLIKDALKREVYERSKVAHCPVNIRN